jgi:hypothetical protein
MFGVSWSRSLENSLNRPNLASSLLLLLLVEAS